MHILAISGSLRTGSTNTSLLRAIAELVSATATITLYNGLDTIPAFSPERDQENKTEAVHHLRQLLREADAVLFSTPEYIHGTPGTLKNMLDWLASSGEFVGKPVGVISAGPSDTGDSRAHAALSYTLTVLTAQLPEQASLVVPFIKTKLNTAGRLTDPDLIRQVEAVVDALVQAVEHKGQPT